MACFRPLRGRVVTQSDGSRKFQFLKFRDEQFEPDFMHLPCGRCIGCRLEYSRQWAVRCMHEASLYDDNCFVTLTYDDEHLPRDGSLNKKHFQDFMKRVRRKFADRKIRYYHCGEYGDAFGRPHYHALLFNFDFDDKVHVATRDDCRLYESDNLNFLWKKGHTTLGDVTFESAAYVARYCTKKVTGDAAEEHYLRVDEATGHIYKIQPEYATMSSKPGIGAGWLDRYFKDVFPNDFVVARGKKCSVPRYYMKLLERRDPALASQVVVNRAYEFDVFDPENSQDRLLVREQVARARLNRFQRGQ